jgi:hypothetical protein
VRGYFSFLSLELRIRRKREARRWRPDASVAVDHRALDSDRAARGIDHATKFDNDAVARPLNDPAIMHGYGRSNEVAAQRAQPRENSLLILAREPDKADYVGGEDRGELAAFAHLALWPLAKLAHGRDAAADFRFPVLSKAFKLWVRLQTP